jgi:hypothetical protein
MLGSITLSNVNTSTFDTAYEAALTDSMEMTLNNGTAGATVTINDVEAGVAARRGLLVGDSVHVSYGINIIMELYGVGADDVFDVVNDVLVAATEDSTSLQDTFNNQLVARLGSAAMAVGIDELTNVEDDLVISVLNTPAPSAQPSTAPVLGSSSSNDDDTTLIIIIVVVVGSVLIVCSAGVYWFVFHRHKDEGDQGTKDNDYDKVAVRPEVTETGLVSAEGDLEMKNV